MNFSRTSVPIIKIAGISGSLLAGIVGVSSASVFLILTYAPWSWVVNRFADVATLDALRGITGLSLVPLLSVVFLALGATGIGLAWLATRRWAVPKKRIGVFIAGMFILSFLIVQALIVPTVVFATASSSQTAIGGTFQEEKPCSYYIFTDGTYYYAQNCDTGAIAFGGPQNAGGATGTSASSTIQTTINGCPSNSACRIGISTGVFSLTSAITISTSGISLIGSGVSNNGVQAFSAQGNPPTALYGTVFKISGTNDAIDVKGTVYGLILRDFGIWFTGATSGIGIHAYSGKTNTNGMAYSTIDNVQVFNNDGNHYAFDIQNMQLLTLNSLVSWGGPILRLSQNITGHEGNSIIQGLYSYVNLGSSLGLYALNISGANGPNQINLISFDRPQINYDPSSNPQGVLKLLNANSITFYSADFEMGSTAPTQPVIQANSSNNIVFENAFFFFSGSTNQIGFDSNSYNVQFIGGNIGTIKNIGSPGSIIKNYSPITFLGTLFNGGRSYFGGIVSVSGAVNSVTFADTLGCNYPSVITVAEYGGSGAGAFYISPPSPGQITITFTNQPGASTWYFLWSATC